MLCTQKDSYDIALGLIIYLIEYRYFSRHKQRFLYLADIIYNGTFGFGKLTQKGRFVFVTLLIWNNVLTEQFL